MNALFEDEGFQKFLEREENRKLIEGAENAAESIKDEKEGNAKGYERFLKVV